MRRGVALSFVIAGLLAAGCGGDDGLSASQTAKVWLDHIHEKRYDEGCRLHSSDATAAMNDDLEALAGSFTCADYLEGLTTFFPPAYGSKRTIQNERTTGGDGAVVETSGLEGGLTVELVHEEGRWRVVPPIDLYCVSALDRKDGRVYLGALTQPQTC